MLEALREFAIRFFQNPLLAEILLKSLFVIIPSAGFQIITELIAKKSRLKDLYGNIVGYSANVLIGVLMAYTFRTGKSPEMIAFEMIGYGFGAVFLHWFLVKIVWKIVFAWLQKKFKIKVKI
jgi:hypothetical protein